MIVQDVGRETARRTVLVFSHAGQTLFIFRQEYRFRTREDRERHSLSVSEVLLTMNSTN